MPNNNWKLLGLMLVSFFALTAFWTHVLELGERTVQRRWAGRA